MNTSPLVTVVITTYNCQDYVEETIRSALAQDYPNLEVILVDDGSSDNTVLAAKRFVPEITVIEQTNSGGPSKPRNTGLTMAKGKYISFLDGDDILEPDRTLHQVNALERYPAAAICVGDYRNFRGTALSEGHFSSCPELSRLLEESSSDDTLILSSDNAAQLLLKENFTITVSVMYRTDLAKAQGGFNETLKACEDYHLNYRMASRHPVVVLNRHVFRRRMHDNNVSSNPFSMLFHYTLSRTLLMKQETSFARAKTLKTRARNYHRSFLKLSIKKLKVWRIIQALSLAKALYWDRVRAHQ